MTTLYIRLECPTKTAWEAVRADYPQVERVYEGSRTFDEQVMPEWEVNIICHGVEVPAAWVPFVVDVANPKVCFAGVDDGQK
jgi:hypothetical protein